MDSGSSPDVFVLEKESQPWKKLIRQGWGIGGVLLILALVVVGSIWYVRRVRVPPAAPAPLAEASPSAPAPTATTVAPAQDTRPAAVFGEANYTSEHFHVGEMALGGESAFLLSEDVPGPIEISSIRGEAFTEKNKPEVKLVLSWKTNRLAKSDVHYSKGVGQPDKTVAEDDYSLSHSVIIAGLDQASTYVYSIVSHDRFGNESTSESHAVYTGSRTVSLFDLIAGAVGDVFGWAVKK